ncbi:phage tail assembly chaperone [Pseudomonas guariconensis]|uniref:phage tail assembly chaperone n=1 Tax=Pseudomonas guariconensis TaxID=1288410 RepID=UPI002D1F3E2D|nr:phage tail assembly chaperone [Pseudomonas guariconensis]MEB3843536.1 phage tail assembly chaperone [Pseudomonas guariconensis]MEB3876404.1 phage tail assembly chaperone [Pseudomonas guariconensis]MEB3881539.1 phage tail assembly chaperone [Pseudomonas guariconensis]MEB3898158.1 phage tail assembly chaperone [Pseudomonas guariconensis]
MAKISILQNPTFKADVEIPRVGDKPVKVQFVFNYLDRDKLADFTDAGLSSSKEVRELLEKDPTVREVTAKIRDHQIEQLQTIIASWGFEEELNESNLRALVGSAASVPEAILIAYHGAYKAAREGN